MRAVVFMLLMTGMSFIVRSADDRVRLSEIFFRSALPDRPVMIELQNHSDETLDISGYTLVDIDGNACSLPAGSRMAAGGFLVVVFGEPEQIPDFLHAGAEWVFCRDPELSTAIFKRMWKQCCTLFSSPECLPAQQLDQVAWGYDGSLAEASGEAVHWGGRGNNFFAQADGSIARIDEKVHWQSFMPSRTKWHTLAPGEVSLGYPNKLPAPRILRWEPGYNIDANDDGTVEVSGNIWYGGAYPADGYFRVQVAKDPGFSEIILDETTTDMQMTGQFTTPLFYWRVRWETPDTAGAWTESRCCRYILKRQWPVTPLGDIRISEITLRPTRNGSPVMVELLNAGETRQSLAGWRLADGAGHSWSFPDQAELPPGEVLVVVFGPLPERDEAGGGWLSCSEPWASEAFSGEFFEECALYAGTESTGETIRDYMQWGHGNYRPENASENQKAAEEKGIWADGLFCETIGETRIPGRTLGRLPADRKYSYLGSLYAAMPKAGFIFEPDDISMGRPNPLPRPRSRFPGDTASFWLGDSALANFRWTDLRPEGIPFRFQLARDVEFTDLVIDELVRFATYPICDLPAGHYFWRVRLEHPSETGAWSPVYPFVVFFQYDAARNEVIE